MPNGYINEREELFNVERKVIQTESFYFKDHWKNFTKNVYKLGCDSEWYINSSHFSSFRLVQLRDQSDILITVRCLQRQGVLKPLMCVRFKLLISIHLMIFEYILLTIMINPFNLLLYCFTLMFLDKVLFW